jgi:undecaprenyl-diphosphatase
MHPLTAMFLGLVQGLTELLPISSSGHLAIFRYFFGLQEIGLTFDILLHLATSLALLLYFSRDWLTMAQAVVKPSPFSRLDRRLFICLVAASVPGALAGVLLESKAETIFQNPIQIAILLGSVGLLLILAERLARHQRPLNNLNLGDALLIGLSQALAIMPGVSRSGITMTCALLLGFSRESAARFSFLMATPIILGGGLWHMRKWVQHPPEQLSLLVLVLGFVTAFVSSYLTIAFFLRFLRRHTFYPFAYYRLGVAVLVLLAIFFSR